MRFIVPGGVIILSLLALWTYYGPAADYHKASDWYSLRDYLRAQTTAADAVIVASIDPTTGFTDPAFAYYYPGPAFVQALPHPSFQIEPTVADLLARYRAVWFVVTGEATAPVNDALLAHGELVTDQGAGRFLVRQYRAKAAKPSEIDHPVDITFGGDTARLAGYALTGTARRGGGVAVLLFWAQPPPPEMGLKVFVHLIEAQGGTPMAQGGPPVAQDDHAPATQPGRDTYHLDLSQIPPGAYQIRVGLYDPASGARVLISGTEPAQDSYPLTALTIP